MMKPLAGVELDDSSHNRKERQDRDVFVEQAFSAAQLPLVRIRVQREYNLQELVAQVEPFLPRM